MRHFQVLTYPEEPEEALFLGCWSCSEKNETNCSNEGGWVYNRRRPGSQNGVGIDTLRASIPQGLGLVNIKERTRLVNGALRIESQPNQGTTLNVTVPILNQG